MFEIGVLAGLLALAGVTIDFVDERREMQAQLSYEENFLKIYQKFLNQPEKHIPEDKHLPLLFAPESLTDLLKMCRNFRSPWMPRYHLGKGKIKKYDRHTEIQRVVFRKLEETEKPIPVEMIRCSDQFALVALGDDFSGYLLEKKKDDKKQVKKEKQEKQEEERKGEIKEDTQEQQEEKDVNEEFFIYRKFFYEKFPKDKKSPTEDAPKFGS